jgi:hypothetical protein
VLERRWRALVTAETIEDKGKLFRVTRDRSLITRAAEGMPGFGEPTLAELPADAPVPSIIRYCYRSFDRRYALFDGRLGDFLRPELFGTLSATQFFLCGLLTKTSASGPSLVATALVPDMDVFCGRGAKDIIPVYRDSHHHVFNLTRGLTEVISTSFATTVTGEDLVAYVVAILGSQTYAQRFWSELSTPGPRVPITKSEVLFREIAALGRELICLQTFGDRMNDTDHQGPSPGIARCGVAVPDAAGSIPEDFRYDEATRELFVGDGRFDNVTPEVMSFEVSGLKVVDSWLGYRMREPRGRVTSELNEILPIAWDHRMTDELLELLWTLERIVALEPQLENALARVVASECFVASELPSPAEIERRPAGTETVTQGGLFED